MTAPVHFIELYADRGEIAPRLVCTATPDAPCRRRPTDPDAETWTDEDETTPGHECWATEWAANDGFDDAVTWGLGSGTLASVPVHVSYDHRGVLAEPVVLPDLADLLPVTADGTSAPQVGDTIDSTPGLDMLPAGSIVRDRDGDTLRREDWGDWTDTDGNAAAAPYLLREAGPVTLISRPDAPQPTTTHNYCANCEGIDPASCINAEPIERDTAIERAAVLRRAYNDLTGDGWGPERVDEVLTRVWDAALAAAGVVR